MFPVILLLFAAIPYDHEPEHAPDVELNHVIGEGDFRMAQLIFREHTPYRTQIYAWVLPKALIVTSNHLTFESNNEFRIITYGNFRETFTEYDPEVDDRQTNPWRRGLRQFHRKGE